MTSFPDTGFDWWLFMNLLPPQTSNILSNWYVKAPSCLEHDVNKSLQGVKSRIMSDI